jgi:UDP:flavonoid glycosyltransferase YjiC (YdhE family)
VKAFVQTIRSYKADAVVDFWNFAGCIAARITATPLITVISSFQHPESPGFIWWKDPPAKIPTAVPWLNGILGQYGLPAIKNAGDLFIGDRTLVLGIPELDPLPETAKATYIGAVLWENPEARLPDWFAALRRDKPVVWIYPGKLRYWGKLRTWGDSEIVLQSSIQALAKEDVQVVVGIGHQDIPRSMLPLPASFVLEPFLPGLTMAGRSDLMIHHGGYGSCQTGLYAGVPQVIIPTFSERESNARRVLQQGAGEIVLPTSSASGKEKKVDSEELAAKVRKVLSTPSYKGNALRISAKLKEYGGPSKAAQLIEEVIK